MSSGYRAAKGALRYGTPVRMKEPCAWPERAGCSGIVVAPAEDGTYPQPGPNEVLVLLYDDPLANDVPSRDWSCVVLRRNVEVLG
jgi:hypothetical protein